MTKLIPLGEDKNKKYLYRCVDDYGHIGTRRYEIIKETPCGYWIKLPFSREKKWTAKTGRNNFAKQTREEAMENYYHRKVSQVAILQGRLKMAETLLEQAEEKTGRKISSDVFLSNIPIRAD